MGRTKEKIKNKIKKDCEPILELLFSGQNPMEKIRLYQIENEEKNGITKKRWFFAQ